MRPTATIREISAAVRRHFNGYRSRLVGLGIVSAAAALMEALILMVLVPLALLIAEGRHVWDTGILGIEYTSGQLATMGIAFVILRLLLQIWAGAVSGRIVSVYEADRRRSMFAAFIDATWESKSKETAGRLQTILTTNIERNVILMFYLTQGLTFVCNLVVLLGMAVVIDPLNALVIVALGVALYIVLRPFSAWTNAASDGAVACNVEYADHISQNVALGREIHVFDVGDAFKRRIGRVIDNAKNFRFQSTFVNFLTPAIYTNAVLLIALGGLAVVLATGVNELATLGVIVLLLLRSMAYGQGLQMMVQRIHETLPFLDQFTAIENQYANARRPDGHRHFERFEMLEFDGVSFGYHPPEMTVEDVCFTIHRGEIIGVVGPSGAGKSTLMQLLLRLRHPQRGEIRVNGEPLDDITLASWYAKLSFVPQESVLLDVSIEDNIRFFRPDLDRHAIEQAARLAQIHEEICGLADGYATLAGDRGNDVSGGQRQRICIARALVGKPDLLVFDEPTSALDAVSEMGVQRTLQDLKAHGEVTMFIIAHRLSTLRICDRIMVVRDGRLDAFDTPDALFSSNRFFQEALRHHRADFAASHHP